MSFRAPTDPSTDDVVGEFFAAEESPPEAPAAAGESVEPAGATSAPSAQPQPSTAAGGSAAGSSATEPTSPDDVKRFNYGPPGESWDEWKTRIDVTIECGYTHGKSWARHLYWKGTVAKDDGRAAAMICGYVNHEGYRCGVVYHTPSFQKNNAEPHARAHKYSETNPPNERRQANASVQRQRTIDEMVNNRLKSLLKGFCNKGIAFSAVEDGDIRDALTGVVDTRIPNRRAFANMLPKLAEEVRKKALKFFENPTLCLDVGTVLRRRFLTLVLAERGYTFVYKCISDQQMADRRMTIDSIRRKLCESATDLAGKGVRIFSLVADNASNMQGLATCQLPATPEEHDALLTESDSDEPESDEVKELRKNVRKSLESDIIVFVSRCSAHTLQLAVKDFSALWKPVADHALELLTEARKQGKKLPFPNQTRWSSHHRLLQSMLDKMGSELTDADRVEFNRACSLLSPFQQATDVVQSDWATMTWSVAAWAELLHTLKQGCHE